jgi:hypothetical protein
VQVQAVPLMVLTKSKLAARPFGGHAVSCTLASTCKTCVCSAYNFVLTIESLFSGDSLKVEGKAKQELIGTMHTDNQSALAWLFHTRAWKSSKFFVMHLSF